MWITTLSISITKTLSSIPPLTGMSPAVILTIFLRLRIVLRPHRQLLLLFYDYPMPSFLQIYILTAMVLPGLLCHAPTLYTSTHLRPTGPPATRSLGADLLVTIDGDSWTF